MSATVVIAAWLVGAYYAVCSGGPAGIVRALRDPDVGGGWKVALALCALPIPGPVDELAAAAILRHLARR